MSTLSNKHLKRKTRQSDINTKRIIHKFDAYYNPEDEKSKDRAYQYSLGATKKEYKHVKRKAEEVGDAIRGVLSENLVGKLNTKEVRLNLAEALEKLMNDGMIANTGKYIPEMNNTTASEYNELSIPSTTVVNSDGSYTVTVKALETDALTKNGDVYPSGVIEPLYGQYTINTKDLL